MFAMLLNILLSQPFSPVFFSFACLFYKCTLHDFSIAVQIARVFCLHFFLVFGVLFTQGRFLDWLLGYECTKSSGVVFIAGLFLSRRKHGG